MGESRRVLRMEGFLLERWKGRAYWHQFPAANRTTSSARCGPVVEMAFRKLGQTGKRRTAFQREEGLYTGKAGSFCGPFVMH